MIAPTYSAAIHGADRTHKQSCRNGDRSPSATSANK